MSYLSVVLRSVGLGRRVGSVLVAPVALAVAAAALAPLQSGCAAGGGATEEDSGAPARTVRGSAQPSGSGASPVVGIDLGGPDLGAGNDDEAVSAECDNILPILYRDFSEDHPDFEMDFRGDVVRRQLIEPTLGPDGTPTFKDSRGCAADLRTPDGCQDWRIDQPVIGSAITFQDWYHDRSGVNFPIPGELVLTEQPGGLYSFDSTAFFPLSPTDGFGVTPRGHSSGRNYLFTTELHVQFVYAAGQVFRFRGDDDLWIFINGRLAMDLGGMHGPEEGILNFDAQAAALGISVGGRYPMDLFHAERHTDGSNFRFETNISCFEPANVR